MRPQREAATKQRSHFGVLYGAINGPSQQSRERCAASRPALLATRGLHRKQECESNQDFVGPFPTMNNDAMDPVRITGAPAERRGSAF